MADFDVEIDGRLFNLWAGFSWPSGLTAEDTLRLGIVSPKLTREGLTRFIQAESDLARHLVDVIVGASANEPSGAVQALTRTREVRLGANKGYVLAFCPFCGHSTMLGSPQHVSLGCQGRTAGGGTCGAPIAPGYPWTE